MCVCVCVWTAQPDKRVFRSKYVFKDISGSPNKRTPTVLVDYDGKQREQSALENAYRTWESKREVVRKGDTPGRPVEAKRR